MEVEVKLRLLTASAHTTLTTVLYPHHMKTYVQENMFFDTPTFTLSTNLSALRLRFYNIDSHSILSLKCNPSISSGISRIQELEQTIEPTLARLMVTHPDKLLELENSEIVEKVKREYGVEELVCLGGFRNVRGVYEWEGLVLEVDETEYEFGTCWEVECESDEPEKAKIMIEGLLRENGIEFVYSESNKFAVFRSGKLPG